MIYQANYKRCVFVHKRPSLPITLLLIPQLIIALMYGIMTFVIIKNRIPAGKLIKTTTAILFTGFITILPEILIVTFNLKFSYEMAQLFTITMFHMNCIYNPVIYFIMNPKVNTQLKEKQESVRKSLVATRSMSASKLKTMTSIKNLFANGAGPGSDTGYVTVITEASECKEC